MEMRQNTQALRAQTYQDLMQQVNDFRVLLLEQPERYAIEEKWESDGWGSLTQAEQQALSLPMQVLFGVYETAFIAYERGVLGDREWGRFEDGICRNSARPDELLTPQLLTSEFRAWIDSNCDGG